MENKDAEGWNTDEVLLDALTGEEIARLSTAFLATYRMLRGGYNKGGTQMLTKMLIELLAQNIEVDESGIFDGDLKSKESGRMVALLSCCMGTLAAIDKLDPRNGAYLGVNLLSGSVEMTNKTGPLGTDDMIIVDAKRKDGAIEGNDLQSIQLGLRVESTAEIDAKIDLTEQGKKISELIASHKQKYKDQQSGKANGNN